MSKLSKRIDEVIEERHSRLPLVRNYVDAIDKLDTSLRNLDTALADAAADPAIGSEIRPLLEEFRTVSPLSGIEEMRQYMSVVRARFERGTINIGVSGQARVGKSTLLQSLSGLGDEQIPTGQGRPVTAVRSRIEHSSNNIARVQFHSWPSFREEVLRPYFNELALPTLPSSIEEFQKMELKSLVQREDLRQRQRNILRDLREAQESSSSFQGLLTGQEDSVPLNDIKEYVKKSYSENGDIPSRKYLAVQKVRIQCTFPFDEVRRVVLIDLPGLGEISPEAEERHIEGLQNDTDVVVLLKRPTQQTSFWKEEDAQTLDLVERARGDIKRTSDFMFILKNQSPNDNPELVAALGSSLAQDLNDSRPNDPLNILTANAQEQQSAIDDVLRPLLEHLADNLSRLDQEVLEGAQFRCANQVQSLLGLLTTLEETLKSLGREGDDFHEIIERAADMRRKIAVELEEQVLLRLKRARDSIEDADYIELVESIYGAIIDELQSGFHENREEWVRRLYETIRADNQTSPIAGREINRFRVEISRRFNNLDSHFQKCVDELINSIAFVVTQFTGGLLDGKTGRIALAYLKQLSLEADRPAQGFASAISELLQLKIEYKTHLHPMVRKELDILQLERDNPEKPGEKLLVVSGNVSEQGAEKVATELTQLGRQAAWGVRKALLQQAVIPELILHSAAEQFVDATIRHGAYESEFQELARAYRDNIWPGLFKGMKIRSARVVRLRNSLRDAKNCIVELTGGN